MNTVNGALNEVINARNELAQHLQRLETHLSFSLQHSRLLLNDLDKALVLSQREQTGTTKDTPTKKGSPVPEEKHERP